MSDPEYREFENQEWSEREDERIEALEDRAEAQCDESLLDYAEARALAWAIDRIFQT